jgi:murein L,D-transpeptidase YcbB/YkuD
MKYPRPLTRVSACLRLAAGLCALLGAALAQAQPPGDFASPLEALIASGRHPFLRAADFERDRDDIRAFYERRQSRPAWFADRELSRQGALLLQALRAAADYGLRPDDYEGTLLAYRIIDTVSDPGAAAEPRAELDLALTVVATRWLRHLHFGRVDARAAGFDTSAPRAPLDVAAVLERLAGGDDFDGTVAGVEPPVPQYRWARRALRAYRLLAADREFTRLPPLPARSIRSGEAYEGAPALRRLLAALGDLAPGAAGAEDRIVDGALAAALARFQQRHGLVADGVLGPDTFSALTTPLSVRAEQLALALERWRWLPELPAPPIVVNIPQFRLLAHGGDGSPFQTEVIVGGTNPALRTPAFAAQIEYVVFRPYWEIPRSILLSELLPRIRANPAYLQRNDLEIVSASEAGGGPVAPSAQAIERLASGELRLRQRPGEANALGLVKLLMPNPYNVYLHSTPERQLFAETRRTFSHGCIRVHDIVGLVEHLLRDEPGEWTRAKIEQAMRDSAAGDNRHVALVHPKPVLIVYGTAIVSPDGKVSFFRDVYGHDATLRRLLREGAH